MNPASLSRNLRKVLLLLQAFEDAAKRVDYYALDLSRDELERTLAHLPDFNYVTCRGLWGTYGDGREWLRASGDRPKSILHMGSSIGRPTLDSHRSQVTGPGGYLFH